MMDRLKVIVFRDVLTSISVADQWTAKESAALPPLLDQIAAPLAGLYTSTVLNAGFRAGLEEASLLQFVSS